MFLPFAKYFGSKYERVQSVRMTCFHQFRNDIRNTWKTINEILTKNKTKQKLPTIFKENGTDITGNINIANKFNTFLQMSARKLQQISNMMVTRITVFI